MKYLIFLFFIKLSFAQEIFIVGESLNNHNYGSGNPYFTIALAADVHWNGAVDSLWQGADVLFDSLQAQGADYISLIGDIFDDDGDTSDYIALSDSLEVLTMPYFVTSSNHDYDGALESFSLDLMYPLWEKFIDRIDASYLSRIKIDSSAFYWMINDDSVYCYRGLAPLSVPDSIIFMSISNNNRRAAVNPPSHYKLYNMDTSFIRPKLDSLEAAGQRVILQMDTPPFDAAWHFGVNGLDTSGYKNYTDVMAILENYPNTILFVHSGDYHIWLNGNLGLGNIPYLMTGRGNRKAGAFGSTGAGDQAAGFAVVEVYNDAFYTRAYKITGDYDTGGYLPFQSSLTYYADKVWGATDPRSISGLKRWLNGSTDKSLDGTNVVGWRCQQTGIVYGNRDTSECPDDLGDALQSDGVNDEIFNTYWNDAPDSIIGEFTIFFRVRMDALTSEALTGGAMRVNTASQFTLPGLTLTSTDMFNTTDTVTIMITRDVSNVCSLYVNGTFKATGSTASNILSSTLFSSSGANFAACRMFHWLWYDEVLDAGEITTVRNYIE